VTREAFLKQCSKRVYTGL